MTRKAIVALASLALAPITFAQGTQKPAPKTPAAVADFEKRINQYLEQRKQEAGKLPGPTDSATKLTESQQEIRARVQAHRKDAKRGDIFTPAIASYFRKQISAAFAGQRGARVLASLRRAEPMKELRLRVNEQYPEALPFQSMPPTLLMKLPKLPKELEYRIVGDNLILRDMEANLVVDILPDSLPKAVKHAS